MAISGGDGSIILTTKVDDKGLKKGIGSIKKLGGIAGKAFLAIGVAAGAATVAITKMAVSAYADYEQLVGGVETLFKGSAQKVIDYANDAFYTAGISANEYMKNVTSFSASLLSSLGGDTSKAADIANQALIDISDNANKMGSSIESVTNAFQGFAKQQYMLLDNLKLGYGGTKTEMERLLKDAQAITGVEYDIDNLGDVYSAIHIIQEELGIAGTTAKEAEKTITGSANMMKSAWQNVLSAVAGGGDLDRAINNLVYSVQKYFENIVPVVQRSLMGIGELIEKVAPLLVETVASALIKAIPSLVFAVYKMIIGLGKGIADGIASLFSGKQGSVTAQLNSTAEAGSNAADGMGELAEATKDAGKEAKKSLASFDDLSILSQGGEEENNLGEVLKESIADTPSVTEEITAGDEGLDASPFAVYFDTIKSAMMPLIDATTQWFNTLDFAPIREGFVSLLEPLQVLGGLAQDILFHFYTEFLLPLSTWSINELAPVMLDLLSKAFDALGKVITPVWEGLKSLWEYLKPIFDWVGDKVLFLLGKLGDAFDSVGQVFVEKSDKIQEAFTMIGEIVQEIWVLIEPIVNWIVEFIGIAFDSIDETIADIIDLFYGIISFISNIFKGEWKKAWDDIVGVFKSIVNVFIEAINVLIRGLNKVHFDLPNWSILGDWAGKKLGINIPEIPRLAQGAVIPPNREFLAVLGDQKHGMNIEAPLQTIVDAFNMALAQNGGRGNTEVILEVDGREFGRAVVEQGNRENRRVGTRLVIG